MKLEIIKKQMGEIVRFRRRGTRQGDDIVNVLVKQYEKSLTISERKEILCMILHQEIESSILIYLNKIFL